MAGQPYGRNHLFRDHLRLVANNHRIQRHVVKSVANQRWQIVSGTISVDNREAHHSRVTRRGVEEKRSLYYAYFVLLHVMCN